ncbi:hypothetical protein HYV83_04225 [Candidatus Woesearchaeota archaeon]|nr:hypothetical protein [Candidatus Woesearchaeota archaeon]
MRQDISIDMLVGNVNMATKEEQKFIYDIEHYVWRGGSRSVMRRRLASSLQKKIVGLPPEAGELNYFKAYIDIRMGPDNEASEFLRGYTRTASYLANPLSEGIRHFVHHYHERHALLNSDSSGLTLVSNRVATLEKSPPSFLQGARFFEKTYQGLVSKMPLN